MSQQQKTNVLVVLGQTATGKSDLAVKIARKLNGEIISADSRQVYKGLDIGTGKITKKEMKGVVHHLIDVADPKKVFTVAKYKKLAQKKIKEIVSRGHLAIVCGGTGFYIDALVEDLVLPKVAPNRKLRKKLEAQSAMELFEILNKLDPRRALEIQNKNEINNKVRLIRAIEIAEALGEVPYLATRLSNKYSFIKIGLILPKEILLKKVEKRVKKMFNPSYGRGLLAEIKKLKKAGISEKRLRDFGFEYNNPSIDSVIMATQKYAKRQMTWFKRDGDIKWFHPNSTKEIYDFIKQKLK